MRYSKINSCDLVNSFKGVAVSLWTQGCPHGCPECFNPETHDINGGSKFLEEDLEVLFDCLESKYVSSFSILGGEPFSPENIDGTLEVILKVRAKFPDITISVWTGYRKEQINRDLRDIDYLVDGRFIKELSNKNLKHKGSENQRIWKFDLRKYGWEVIG